jgi:hypothetical protein
MEKHLTNNSMEICFDSETMALKVLWKAENSSLSVNEYVDCWIAILRYIEVFTPKFLLIDAYLLDFRVVPELYPVMDNILQSMKSNNVAIVMACSILGKSTLNDLIKKCSLNEWVVFDSNDKGQVWLESCIHFPYIAK